MSNTQPQEDGVPSYFLPVNQAEAERLLSQHLVLVDALNGRIVLPPIDLTKPGLKILDSGTADGHWINELRKTFPDPSSHTYVGTDLNPSLFPQALPPDTSFLVQNIAHEWPVHLHSTFDLVHQRLTLPGAAPTPLPQAIHQLFQLLKPGAWVQLVEAEQEGPSSGPVFSEFLELVRGLFDATGAGWHYAKEMRRWLEAEGAMDVDECMVDMGFGAKNPDPKLAAISAKCTAQAMDGLVKHAKLAPNLENRLSIEQIDTLGDRLFKELVERGACYRIRCVWGRKKFEGEE
ncbi:putative Wax synthase domain-containing protein [Seiridium cardinale]|uniref:Wax synthase domain-containing protein n=1 Tax=Seiridium cardinale TaxID=138064 RepID=A0ABR2XF64_9PEZI